MTSGYATAAYLLFAAALAWDYTAPRVRLRRALRDIAARARRNASKSPSKDPGA